MKGLRAPIGEARRFYRSGVPFWQRYLPFWLAVLVRLCDRGAPLG